MLSSVLQSELAILVNIAIMRAFSKLRRIIASNKEIAEQVNKHDKQIQTIFSVLKQLMSPQINKTRKKLAL